MYDAVNLACGDGKNIRNVNEYEDLGACQTGNINVISPRSQDDIESLDEPIIDTILRDVKTVGKKFLYVLYPKGNDVLLKEWDLWGPLFLCTLMALILRGSSNDKEHDGGPELAQVYVIIWLGSFLVTLNTKLLGGTISFLQIVCILGYCLLPTSIALVVCRIILLWEQSYKLFLLRFLATVLGFSSASYAAGCMVGRNLPHERLALALYPVFLFYFVVSWLIISLTL